MSLAVADAPQGLLGAGDHRLPRPQRVEPEHKRGGGPRPGRAERSQADIPPMPDSSHRAGRSRPRCRPGGRPPVARRGRSRRPPRSRCRSPPGLCLPRDLQRQGGRERRRTARSRRAQAAGADSDGGHRYSGNSENGGRPSCEAPAARRGFHISPRVGGIVVRHEHKGATPFSPGGHPRDHVGALPAGSRRRSHCDRPDSSSSKDSSATAAARVRPAQPRRKGVCIAEGVLVAKRLGAHLLRPGVPEPRRAPFRGLPLALASGAATHRRQRLHVGADRHVRCQSTGPAVSK